MDQVLSLIILLALLEAKHFLCDGPLQTAAMVAAKGAYGAPLGLAHAGIHGIATLLVLLVWGAGPGIAIIIGLAESVVHYHVDFAKERVGRRLGLTPRDRGFWWLLGADQALHRFTYLAIAAAVGLQQE